MASAELRLIRRRISSVQATKKITRAMELIAASRIVRAQARVKESIPYVRKLTEVIQNVSKAGGNSPHALLHVRPVKTVGLVIVGSDRGLAGAYNSNVIRLAEQAVMAHRSEGRTVNVWAVGKKVQSYFRFRKFHIHRTFLGVTDRPGYGDARAIANAVMEAYATGSVDLVELVYTRYVSALNQEPARIQLIPVQPPTDEPAEDAGPAPDYSYEPSPGEILDRILPRYVEARIFGALLESSAGEHASRQRAMKAATDNATELTKVLTRVANQARQAEITTEISEIVGGAEALSEAVNA